MHRIPGPPPPSRVLGEQAAFGGWDLDESTEVATELLYVSIDRRRKLTPQTPNSTCSADNEGQRRVGTAGFRRIHTKAGLPDLGRRIEFQSLREKLRLRVLNTAFALK